MGDGVYVEPKAEVQKVEGRSEKERKTEIFVISFEPWVKSFSEASPTVVFCNNKY